VRAKLLFACLALGGLVSCAAAVKTDPQPEPVAAETSDPHVGKDYWTIIENFIFSSQPEMNPYKFLKVGTHFKIDGVVQGVSHVGLYNTVPDVGHYYYRAVLDDGQVGYINTHLLEGATDVSPTALASVPDREIIRMIIQEQRQFYYSSVGPCACPDDRARNGSACGARSGYTKLGGIKCFPSDVSKADIAKYRATPHFHQRADGTLH
jgi:hypothetical protein